MVGIPSRTYVKKKKKKKLENKKKKSRRWGFSVLAVTREYSGVLGSFGEYWIKLAWGGCVGVGGGYVAPRPGCAFHAGKIPRYGNVFPPNHPFRPPTRTNTARPAVLLSSTQPVRLDKIKAPEEYPGARLWVND